MGEPKGTKHESSRSLGTILPPRLRSIHQPNLCSGNIVPLSLPGTAGPCPRGAPPEQLGRRVGNQRVNQLVQVAVHHPLRWGKPRSYFRRLRAPLP